MALIHLCFFLVAVLTLNTSADKYFCSKQQNGYKRNLEDCSKFYFCHNHVTYEFSCGDVLYFNPKAGGCDWPANVECNPITTASVTRETPPVASTEKITEALTTSTTEAPSMTKTTKSISTATTTSEAPSTISTTDAPLTTASTTEATLTTEAPTTTSMTAAPSTTEAPSTAASTTEALTTKLITIETDSPSTLSETTTSTEPQSTKPTTKSPTAAEFCESRPSGYYEHPISCTKYYQCYSGGALLLMCPPGLQFNIAVSVCDWPVNVNCDGSQIATEATPTTETVSPQACNNQNCIAPSCYCPTTEIPLNLPKEDIPQIVMVTFDDAVTIIVDEFFKQIFNRSRLNPNHCPVTGTYFLSDHYTDYNIIRRLANEGHEIADHSCNHTGSITRDEWEHEIICQKTKINQQLRSTENVVTGWRSPYLRMGGNTLFDILQTNNFEYDSSIAYGFSGQPTWPFTLDIPYNGPCNIPPCPTGSFPGLFEFPLLAYKDKAGYECSMFDGCSNPPSNVQEAFELFKNNFHRHYDTNKAPFPVFGHAAYFVSNPHRLTGFLQFLDYVRQFDDVYVVSVSRALEWMKQPTKLSNIQTFQPWSC